MPHFRVKRLSSDAKLPSKAHRDDAGLDLYSIEHCKVYTKSRAIVRTGIAVEIPRGYAGFVQPRSGLAARKGITVLNTPGLIDSGYRGEIKVILYNSDSFNCYEIFPQDKIAQLVIVEVFDWTPIESDTLFASERNEDGFGSTGIK